MSHHFSIPALALLAGFLLIEVSSEPFAISQEPTKRQRDRGKNVVLNASIAPHWVDDDRNLWYRRERIDELTHAIAYEFVLIDTKLGTRQVFQTEDGLRRAFGGQVSVSTNEIRRVTQFDASPRRSLETGDESSVVFVNQMNTAIELFWIDPTARIHAYGSVEANSTREQHTFAGHVWLVKNSKGETLAYLRAESDTVSAVFDTDCLPLDVEKQREDRRRRGSGQSNGNSSPDGMYTWLAKEGKLQLKQGDNLLTLGQDADPSKGPYDMHQWSPDSKSLVTFRIHEVAPALVYRIESSPESAGRAKLQSNSYALPGDAMTSYELVMFNVDGRQELKPISEKFDFGRPRIRWTDDHRFTVEKIDRGHQRFRIFEVDTRTGESKTILDEKSETFIWTMHGPAVALTTYLNDSRKMIYASERDGWRHLYLVDLGEGAIKHQITRGDWVVRSIQRIDETKQQIWFTASGMNAGQDPYLLHHYRINFDGSELVSLSPGHGTHTLRYSPTGDFYIDSYSRVDAAPIHDLRRSTDGSLVWKLEAADTSRLIASGWQSPEVFSAKGRDGQTDIWGFIARPRDFDAAKRYPVIEYIYAGPHDSHVPKTFQTNDWYSSLTELGFIVVRIDGMGTANRSKAFHDVCWHNLHDAGFPDRIAWMKAAAKDRPYMDLSRVGIYGTSAGGQNAAGALIFHGDFYKVAAAFCGCHDNRMDKASWNEQWMGYPVGPHYAASSNIDHADNLQGHLFLMVGELDSNVPPESTMRFADALIRANKDFEMLVMPGVGHSDGGAYGQRRMRDFFQVHLQSIEVADRQ